MTITFLGTGTSQGVPVIGCRCEVCQSSDPRDKRLRTSVLFSGDQQQVVIDCGPDFRQQMLRENVSRLDALLITHHHNDHIIGLDDVRPFNFMSRQDLLVYATPETQQELHKRFAYIFAQQNRYPGAPMVNFHTIQKDQAFAVQNFRFTPIEVLHGSMKVLGFRIGSFAYITDMKTISPFEKQKLEGVDYLTVNALHHKKHHSHMNLEEALIFVEEIGPKHAFLTHISHSMGLHEKISHQLPVGVQLAYDGLKTTIDL